MSDVSFLPPFISTRTHTKVLGGLLIVTAAVSWTAVGVDWALLHLADEIGAGYEVSRADRLAHTRAASALATAQWICALFTGSLFLAWLYQCRVNVRALGARKLRWRREWTLMAFFVPVINALRPYQVVREVWQASDPSNGDPVGWQKVQVPRLLTCWWVTFLAFLAFELVAFTILLGIDTAAERRLAYSLRTLADSSAAISASLAFFVVQKITHAQEQKRAVQTRTAPSLEFEPGDAIAS
jgi:hypothetical protein